MCSLYIPPFNRSSWMRVFRLRYIVLMIESVHAIHFIFFYCVDQATDPRSSTIFLKDYVFMSPNYFLPHFSAFRPKISPLASSHVKTRKIFICRTNGRIYTVRFAFPQYQVSFNFPRGASSDSDWTTAGWAGIVDWPTGILWFRTFSHYVLFQYMYYVLCVVRKQANVELYASAVVV